MTGPATNLAASLPHELRNALQSSQACLEMLAVEVQDRPAALELIARIQEAQDRLVQHCAALHRGGKPAVAPPGE